MVQRDYEKALFLAIAEGNVHDRPREKEQKAALRENWGNWSECKELLDRSHRRSIVTYLVDHPTDFKRALALLRPDQKHLHVGLPKFSLESMVECDHRNPIGKR